MTGLVNKHGTCPTLQLGACFHIWFVPKQSSMLTDWLVDLAIFTCSCHTPHATASLTHPETASNHTPQRDSHISSHAFPTHTCLPLFTNWSVQQVDRYKKQKAEFWVPLRCFTEYCCLGSWSLVLPFAVAQAVLRIFSIHMTADAMGPKLLFELYCVDETCHSFSVLPLDSLIPHILPPSFG